MMKVHHDTSANLVLLEYLAVRKCHRLVLLDENVAATTATKKAAAAYQGSLLRALEATSTGLTSRPDYPIDKEDGNNIAASSRRTSDAFSSWTSSPYVVVVLKCLQRILETVFMDSYQLASSRKDDTIAIQEGTSPLCAGRRGATTNVEFQHVREAIRALGIQVDDWISASGFAVADKKRSSSSRRTVMRLWRSLLKRHVARRIDILRRLQQQRGRSKPTQIRIRCTDTAVMLIQRFVVSLLDPTSVRLWNGNDGCQISFQSSCGAFHAHYFEFFDDEDVDNDNVEKCEAAPDENAAGGTWIGAVIDCPPPVTPPLPERRRPPMAVLQQRPMERNDNDDDGSTLGSDSHYEDYDSEMEDDDDKPGGGRSDQEEMSTASMTSSLSSTSSSSYSAGPTTGRFVSDHDNGMDTLNSVLVPPHHHHFRRLTLPAVLVATAKFSNRGGPRCRRGDRVHS